MTLLERILFGMGWTMTLLMIVYYMAKALGAQ